jgi:hypothetical protein
MNMYTLILPWLKKPSLSRHNFSCISLRHLLITILLITPLLSRAVDVPAGVYYFDNSKTNYSTVKFVYPKSVIRDF